MIWNNDEFMVLLYSIYLYYIYKVESKKYYIYKVF